MDVTDIETIAVLGAGNMGHGIAEVAALAGYTVRLRDINEELVQNGYEQIEWSLGKLAERDEIEADEADDALERIEPVVDLETSLDDVDFLIEAVPERMDVKRDVYEEVERHAPERTVFASNTSSLSITDLSETTERQERFCGMHFFNPPVRMPLVEVIAGAHTEEWVLDLTEALASEFDKTPIRVRKDSPGFVVNRVLVPLMNEAAWMLYGDEAGKETIDSTTKYTIGLPMGVFELTDQVGLDVAYDVLEYLHDVLGDVYEPCPLLETKIDREELGKKTGQGFYDYEDGGVEIPPDRGEEAIETRMIAMMANEVARLVADDVADVATIDRAMQLGAGFPDGPGKMADRAGLEPLIDTLEARYEETGAARYEVSEGFRERAEAGGFYAETGERGAGDTAAGADARTREFETIRIEYPGDRVGKIVLDRPHRLNTVTGEMLEELVTAIELFEEDDEVRAILLTGAGDRAFSAGADVTNLIGSAEPLSAVELARTGQRTFGRFEDSDLPVVAAIDGYCLGGGMEMVTAVDLRVGSERAQLGQTEHNLGIMPGWGGTQRLARLVGEGRAKEIIFTAERYDAETMERYGFLNEVVPNDELEDRSFELAADLAAGPPIAQRYTKRAIHAGRECEEAGLEVEAQAFGHLMHTDDLMAGITAFTTDEEPEFEGK